MTDLNSISLIGRLTKDVTADKYGFGYLQNGTAKANFSIACNSSRKSQDGQWIEEASYFDITVFGKMAENLKPYLLKGTQVAILGKLKQDRWEKDGQKFSKVYVLADSIQLVGSKNSNGQNSSNSQFTMNSQNTQNYQVQNDSGFPEDIPF